MSLSLISGFDFFKKKMFFPIFLFIIIYVAFLFSSEYLINFFFTIETLSLEFLSITSIASLFFFIIETLKYKLILLLVFGFVILFINNYIIYCIASIISKKKNFKNLGSIFNYTFVLFIILFCFLLLFSLLLLNITLLSTIILIILGIILIVILYLFYLTLFVMATEENLSLKKGLNKSWLLLKKRFWTITFFLIVLFVILEIFNLLFFLIVTPFFEMLDVIILEEFILFVYYLFVTLYFCTSFTVFINKLKKKEKIK